MHDRALRFLPLKLRLLDRPIWVENGNRPAETHIALSPGGPTINPPPRSVPAPTRAALPPARASAPTAAGSASTH
jgi:hypothetical protein